MQSITMAATATRRVWHSNSDLRQGVSAAVIYVQLRYKRVVQDKAATCARLIVDTLQELRQINMNHMI